MSRRSRLNFHNVDIENYRTENNKDYEAVIGTVSNNEGNAATRLVVGLVALLKLVVLILVLALCNEDTSLHKNLWSTSVGSLVLLLSLVDFTNAFGETIKVDDALIALLGLTYNSTHSELGLTALFLSAGAKLLLELEDIHSNNEWLTITVDKLSKGSARDFQVKMMTLAFLSVSSIVLIVGLGDNELEWQVLLGSILIFSHTALVLVGFLLEYPWHIISNWINALKVPDDMPLYLSSWRPVRLVVTLGVIGLLPYGMTQSDGFSNNEVNMANLAIGSYVVASMLGNALDRLPSEKEGIYL